MNNKYRMSKLMKDDLASFFGEKTIEDVDRNTFLIKNLHDNTNKIVISLVFMKSCEGIDPSEYSQVTLEGKGAIFIFPPYWISIPRELVLPYFEYIIDSFYQNEVSEWFDNNSSDNNGNNNQNPVTPPPYGGGSNCGCPCNVV